MTDDEKAIRAGGFAGAIVTFVIAFLTQILLLLNDYSGNPWPYLSSLRLILVTLFVTAIFALPIGFLAGCAAGTSKNVNRAFLWGGMFFGLSVSCCLLVLVVIVSLRFDTITIAKGSVVFVCDAGFAATGGALLSGVSAIFVRDYRQSQRIRLVPQFSLRELLIVVTLSIVMMSFLASIPVVRAWAR